jgi:hypothetical protein
LSEERSESAKPGPGKCIRFRKRSRPAVGRGRDAVGELHSAAQDIVGRKVVNRNVLDCQHVALHQKKSRGERHRDLRVNPLQAAVQDRDVVLHAHRLRAAPRGRGELQSRHLLPLH